MWLSWRGDHRTLSLSLSRKNCELCIFRIQDESERIECHFETVLRLWTRDQYSSVFELNFFKVKYWRFESSRYLLLTANSLTQEVLKKRSCMTAGQILQYESSSFDKTVMDVKQLNGHASSTLTSQPNFAADGELTALLILICIYIRFFACNFWFIRKTWESLDEIQSNVVFVFIQYFDNQLALLFSQLFSSWCRFSHVTHY